MTAAVFITIRHSEIISAKIVSLIHWDISAGVKEILKDRNEVSDKVACGYLGYPNSAVLINTLEELNQPALYC